jgi:hypothetical protein
MMTINVDTAHPQKSIIFSQRTNKKPDLYRQHCTMVLTRNIFALFAGCGVAAVLLNVMEPNVIDSAERFLRGQEYSSPQGGILSAVAFANEEAELALSEFMINPSGNVNDAMVSEK